MEKTKKLDHTHARYEKHSSLDIFLMKAKSSIYVGSEIIQYFVALTILIAIVITLIHVPEELGLVAAHGSGHLIEYLEYVVNIIIAIELVHVLIHQTLDSIVEILSMAITRELVLLHLHTYEILIGILAIGVLFVMRKYLFIPKLDDDDDAQHHLHINHPHPLHHKKHETKEAPVVVREMHISEK